MADKYSKDALLEFLKEAGMSGLMNPALAKSRRLAAEGLLLDLPARESNDLRELCLEKHCGRLNKQESATLRPEVVELYRDRVQGALNDFLTWRWNPDQFKPTNDEAIALRQRRDAQSNRSAEELARERIALSKTNLVPDLLPVPLREDRVVYIQNLPLDLTSEEASKLANVIRALSQQSDN